jgi:hypothetical protein
MSASKTIDKEARVPTTEHIFTYNPSECPASVSGEEGMLFADRGGGFFLRLMIGNVSVMKELDGRVDCLQDPLRWHINTIKPAIHVEPRLSNTWW